MSVGEFLLITDNKNMAALIDLGVTSSVWVKVFSGTDAFQPKLRKDIEEADLRIVIACSDEDDTAIKICQQLKPHHVVHMLLYVTGDQAEKVSSCLGVHCCCCCSVYRSYTAPAWPDNSTASVNASPFLPPKSWCTHR